MALDKIYQVSLILVVTGVVLGMGILLIDKFGDATKDVAYVVNETISIASGTGTTANDELIDVTYMGNNSIIYATICNDRPGCDVNFTTESGVITVNSTKWIAGDYDISYSYYADSETTTAVGGVNTELSGIATTWIPIVIIVAIAGLLIVLVASGFVAGRRR